MHEPKQKKIYHEHTNKNHFAFTFPKNTLINIKNDLITPGAHSMQRVKN